MPNHDKSYNKETEKQLVIENLQALQSFLIKLNKDDDWQNPHKYIILEYFPKENDNPLTYIPNVYELLNLKIDTIEDGEVLFDDGEGILEEAMENNTPLPLHHFCIDNIVMIYQQDNDIIISMGYGYIQITY